MARFHVLTCLVLLTLSLACVDLTTPWNEANKGNRAADSSATDRTVGTGDTGWGNSDDALGAAGGSVGSDSGRAVDQDLGTGGTASEDASIVGGFTGTGGTAVGTGGTVGSGGSPYSGGTFGAGGALGLGGARNGGSLGAGGLANPDGSDAPDAAFRPGGIVGTGGAGGTAGSIGSGGGVGTGGDGPGGRIGTGGTVGTGGATGRGGARGSCTNASGVAVLTVPLAISGEGQRFNYQNFNSTDAGSYSLLGATVNIVACVPDAIGGNLHVFFTTSSGVDSAAIDVALSTLTTGFQTIGIPVPLALGDFDPATVVVVHIEVEAGSAFGASWQTPATVVYIDSISSSNGRFNDTFDASARPLQYSGARVTATKATLNWVSDYSR